MAQTFNPAIVPLLCPRPLPYRPLPGPLVFQTDYPEAWPSTTGFPLHTRALDLKGVVLEVLGPEYNECSSTLTLHSFLSLFGRIRDFLEKGFAKLHTEFCEVTAAKPTLGFFPK